MIAALGASAAMGCGSTGGGGSGVSDGTKLSNVSQTDADAICKEVSDEIAQVTDSSKDRTCTISGLEAAAGGGNCEDVKKTCLDQNSQSQSECKASDVQAINCPDLTMGQWRDCMDAVLKESEDAPKISCSSTVQDLNAASKYSTELPDSCKTVFSKCPAIQQQISGSSSSSK